MPRLLLLRHGQSTWNAEERWQGWADPPLSPLGQRQAEAAARWLAGEAERFERVVSSDLARARRTAEIVADGLGTGPVEVEPALRERDVGDWTGLTSDEIGLRWPEVLQAWRERRLVATPGGEPEAALVARVTAALGALAGNGPVLVVTHGGVIRSLERATGTPACPGGNLCGRWMDSTPEGGLDLGPAASLPALDHV